MALGKEVGLGPRHIVVDGDPAPSPKRGQSRPPFLAHFYCGETAGCIKMPLGMAVDLIPGDFVFDNDPAPIPKKGAEPPPQFSAQVDCGQTAGWIKMALGMEVGLGPRHIVLDGDPASSPKRGQSRSPILAHFFGRPFVKRFALCYRSVVCPVLSVLSALSVMFVHCGQTVGWIKMKLCEQVGLGPGHIVLGGDRAPPPLKGHSTPICGPFPFRPDGWMDEAGTWHCGRPQPRRLCVR